MCNSKLPKELCVYLQTRRRKRKIFEQPFVLKRQLMEIKTFHSSVQKVRSRTSFEFLYFYESYKMYRFRHCLPPGTFFFESKNNSIKTFSNRNGSQNCKKISPSLWRQENNRKKVSLLHCGMKACKGNWRNSSRISYCQ